MATSAYLPGSKRQNGIHKIRRPSINNALPVYSSSTAVQEKYARRQQISPWWIAISFPMPCLPTKRLRVWVLNPVRLHAFTTSRFGRKRGSALLCLAIFTLVFIAFAFAKRFGTQAKQWPTPFKAEPSTLVYKREDLQRIWHWEILSGHYPSRRKIPKELRLKSPPLNPALPSRRTPFSEFSQKRDQFATTCTGVGASRIYLNIQSHPPNVAYPPRPVPGSIADLDVVMEHCDFSEKKFVRDCLEVLRVGAGLDNGNHVRRGNIDKWKYIYVEQAENSTFAQADLTNTKESPSYIAQREDATDPDSGLTKRRGVEWEVPPIPLRPALGYQPYAGLSSACDPDSPRLFHMFWTGPFTDKPYLAILSFLFTQNTGLHLHDFPSNSVCRPQFWLWINPGPAAAVPNPSAVHDMFSQLKANPWAAPFLHPRFKDIIQFKLWNTTEQLDGVPELRDEWRSKDLFNSGGIAYNIPAEKVTENQSAAPLGTTSSKSSEEDILNRTGSKSLSTYDRLSVILSDMARFILCHRFGGIYLDADTIFLRDWEELWGWKGAFAYRWSRLEKYNTAVLHLNKNSALGKFLFRTALKNNLDFHPMTVSRYTKEAHLEGLLLRLPDALFDSAWLNTEEYQLSRPPQPFFTHFEQFFDTPAVDGAGPQALGFDGFFKGAYSYHFHNFWWKPFDPSRNWPDLGPRFISGERQARQIQLEREKEDKKTLTRKQEEETVEDDKRDLDWATVLKRTFEAYIRGERPNMYGEWLKW